MAPQQGSSHGRAATIFGAHHRANAGWRSGSSKSRSGAPGSTLYFEWQQTRRSFGPEGDFDFSRDRSALFDAPPDNILLLKVSYWFTR